MPREPAGKSASAFDHKAKELPRELNMRLGYLIRSFLSCLPKQKEKLGDRQKSARLAQGSRELGEGKARNGVCFLFPALLLH